MLHTGIEDVGSAVLTCNKTGEDLVFKSKKEAQAEIDKQYPSKDYGDSVEIVEAESVTSFKPKKDKK